MSNELQENLPPEDDDGPIEYKIHIINLDEKRFHKLITQMLWRNNEGQGECIYYIGITDSGSPRGISKKYMEKSLENLRKVSDYLNYTFEVVSLKKGISGGLCAKILIKSK